MNKVNASPIVRSGGGEVGMKKHWEPMKLTSVGHISNVVEQGGGKITTIVGDPGEPRKVAPTG